MPVRLLIDSFHALGVFLFSIQLLYFLFLTVVRYMSIEILHMLEFGVEEMSLI